MAKARSRAAARKVKDKWKAKNWYQILASPLFDNVPIADTLSDKPNSLIGRVTEASLQDLTNDFRKSHIKLFFKINNVEETSAYTQFVGHTLTSDYLRRMIRRRRSRIDGIYDVTTRDGAFMRVKPFATTERRIQNSQKKLIRNIMKKTITDECKAKTLNEFIRDTLDGKIGSEIYKNCRNIYPVKRVEIHKTEVMRQPTIEVEEKKPKKKGEPEEPKETEKKDEEVTKKDEEKTKVKKPESKKEDVEEETKDEKEEKPEEKPTEIKDEKPAEKTKEKKEAKKTVKKTTTKKPTSKAKTAAKTKKAPAKKKVAAKTKKTAK